MWTDATRNELAELTRITDDVARGVRFMGFGAELDMPVDYGESIRVACVDLLRRAADRLEALPIEDAEADDAAE
jgi:hypothetical protein